MSFILYVVVLAVSISSVMMGLDWLSTPPPSIPQSVQTASAPAKPLHHAVATTAANEKTASSDKKTASAQKIAVEKPRPVTTDGKQPVGQANPPAVAKADTTDKTDASKTPAASVVDAKAAPVEPQAKAAPASPETAGNAPSEAATNALANATDATSPSIDAAAAPRCDVQACAAHYRSFNPGDCTYQPYDGPRRLCTVGNLPREANKAGVETSDARPPQAAASCNIQACAASYHSFDPATCTYQPYDGPRRLCVK